MIRKAPFTLSILVSLIVIYFLYREVLNYDYIWDDYILFVENTSLTNSKLSWDLLARPVLKGSAYFRPVVFASWYYEFKAFGQSPSVSHIINLLIFTFNTWLTYFLSLQVFKEKKYILSFLVLCVYSINPLLIESTVWISGRFDLLVTFFILISINIFLFIYSNPNKILPSFLVGLTAFLAILSKEVAIILPLILICFIFFKEKNDIRDLSQSLKAISKFKLTWFFILIFYIIYFILRYSSLGVLGSATYTSGSITAIYKIFLPLQAFCFYNINYFFPWFFIKPLNPVIYDLSGIQLFRTILLFSTGILFVLLGLRNKYYNTWLYIAAMLTISLVLYIIPLNNGNNVGSIRFMTLGVSFFTIFGVLAANDVYNYIEKKRKIFLKVIFFSFIIIWLVISQINFHQSIKVWKNEYTLWKSAYLVDPNDPTAKYNYGAALLKYGDFEGVKQLAYDKKNGMNGAEQAIYALALTNLRDPESILYFQGLLESLPKYHVMYKTTYDINPLLVYHQVGLSLENIGGAYKNYALSLLLFKNDLEGAKKNNIIASWYFKKDEDLDILADRFIIFYLSGNNSEANDVINRIKNINTLKKDSTKIIINNFINEYCSRFPKNSQCLRWEIKKEKLLSY